MNLFAKNDPLWISHRGYTETATENTLESFQAAVDLGFTALETDLRLTGDGHIVLIHDPTLYRVAGDRRALADLTRRDLATVRLRNGETVLFLDAFLSAFENCRWTFDIKPENGDETVRALSAWAETRNLKEKLIRQAKFLTWRADHESLIRRFFPGARLYARKPECRRAGLSMFLGMPWLGGIQPGRTYALTPSLGPFPLYTNAIIRRYQQKKAHVVAYLPETEDEAGAAVAAGVDEILTNGKIL